MRQTRDDNPVISRGQYNGNQFQRNIFDQLEAYRSGRFAGIGHTLLLGGEYGRQTIDRQQFTGTAPSITLYNPVPDLAPTLNLTPSVNNRFFAQTAAFYVQDLMQLAPQWKLMAGARFDNFKQSLDQRLVNSPRSGTRGQQVEPARGTAVSAAVVEHGVCELLSQLRSVGRIAEPCGQQCRAGAGADGEYRGRREVFEPRRQADLDRGRVWLDRNNIKTPNPANPSQLILAGEQRTLGASLSFQGSVTQRWMVYGGYAYQDAVVVKSNASFNGIPFQGKRPYDIPLHSGSIWSTYRFANGWGAGGGVYFNTDSFAYTDNLVELPGYTRLDATVFYHRRHMEMDAHLSNLTNTRYYDSSHSDLELFPGAPISGAVTARYRF